MLNEDLLGKIGRLEVAEQEAEEKWTENWKASIENIKKLYTL